MPVTTSNLIQGPATLFRAPFGTAEPALGVDLSSPWVDLGGTKDGVELGIADEYSVLDVDQLIYEVDRRRVKRVVTVKTSLAEATLTNLSYAISNSAPVSAGTPVVQTLTPDDGLAAFKPDHAAYCLEGVAPGGFRRRFYLRKALSTDSVAASYKKDGQTLIPVTFTGHWVSASVRPFLIQDATS